ncbi:hypothetical protein HanPI659440_Chr04g0141231 [Helianthus annuus]|nr:hypothetical protein HanPI659440_Chr04g0141231 [Helianthus annuus]
MVFFKKRVHKSISRDLMFLNSMLGYSGFLLVFVRLLFVMRKFLWFDCSMSLVENNRNVYLSYELYLFFLNVLWFMVKGLVLFFTLIMLFCW